MQIKDIEMSGPQQCLVLSLPSASFSLPAFLSRAIDVVCLHGILTLVFFALSHLGWKSFYKNE